MADLVDGPASKTTTDDLYTDLEQRSTHSPEPGSPKDAHEHMYALEHLSPAEAQTASPFSRMMRVRVSIASMTSNRSWHQNTREDGVELMTSVDRAEPDSGSSGSGSNDHINAIGRGIPRWPLIAPISYIDVATIFPNHLSPPWM